MLRKIIKFLHKVFIGVEQVKQVALEQKEVIELVILIEKEIKYYPDRTIYENIEAGYKCYYDYNIKKEGDK